MKTIGFQDSAACYFCIFPCLDKLIFIHKKGHSKAHVGSNKFKFISLFLSVFEKDDTSILSLLDVGYNRVSHIANNIALNEFFKSIFFSLFLLHVYLPYILNERSV